MLRECSEEASQAKGKDEEQHDAAINLARRGSQSQDGTENGADAAGPAYGKGDAKEERSP